MDIKTKIMTREELIKSDEYITATIECMVVSRKPVKTMRDELGKFFIEYRDELLRLTAVNRLQYELIRRQAAYNLSIANEIAAEVERLKEEKEPSDEELTQFLEQMFPDQYKYENDTISFRLVKKAIAAYLKKAQ